MTKEEILDELISIERELNKSSTTCHQRALELENSNDNLVSVAYLEGKKGGFTESNNKISSLILKIAGELLKEEK